MNWAAVAFGIVAGRKLELLWPRLLKEKGFWWGDMPTQSVSKPLGYEKWEYDEPLPVAATPLHDVAAMGRAWYLEAVACRRMKAHSRLVESARKVSPGRQEPTAIGASDITPRPNGTVTPGGAEKYCEYAAILTRVVLGNRDIFFR